MAKIKAYRLLKVKSNRSQAIQQLIKLEAEKSQPGFDDDAAMTVSTEQDHRQVKEYVAGITRWKRWLDFVLAAYYNGDFEQLEPMMVHILRVGAYDLLFLSTPAHAALNEAVELAKVAIHPGAGGLVNGILRAVDRNRDALPQPRKKVAANALGIQYSHPNWMIYRWLKRYGDDIEQLLEWNNKRPIYSLRINTQKISVKAFTDLLDEKEVAWEKGHLLDDFIRLPKLQQVVRGGYLRDGLCAVQDESSGLIVRLVDPKPGQTIVDACAAPGGKTLYAAALMAGEGALHAIDIQEGRLAMLDRVVDRYDAGWIDRQAVDLRSEELQLEADQVLLDAPCSGLGVLSKRADLRWKRKLEDISKVAELQAELLRAAAKLVKPGGHLIYSTCTIEPEENQQQIKHFLSEHKGFELVPATEWLPGEVVDKKGFLSTFPPQHEMDGVFGAKLRRTAP